MFFNVQYIQNNFLVRALYVIIQQYGKVEEFSQEFKLQSIPKENTFNPGAPNVPLATL